MEFQITKEELLKPLQQVIGVVDRKQLQPVLSFVLITVSDNELIISTTDLDIQLCAKNTITPQNNVGEFLLPAKKLLDICKLLPDDSVIKILVNNENNKTTLIANKSRFTLSTLDPKSFPLKQEKFADHSISIPKDKLKNLLASTAFAIAQQDVRHYLLGMLWEVAGSEFKVVATDGHRLAMGGMDVSEGKENGNKKIVVPRKSILELTRLLETADSDVFVNFSDKSAQISTDSFIFTTKLLEVQFPDYRRVFPNSEDSFIVEIDREEFRQVLNRVAILSNEKQRAVRLCFSENQLVIAANNPEQEQAEELLEILYNNLPLEICFNIGYLLDVVNKITTDRFKMQLKQANTPVLITPDNLENTSYIIMPMSL
ncbi:MAG: DNA polymerase III subunit beta [Gammaproteobacteria bacterium]|nr:DNA polymerase III subunit beta [Gammaproteobacteria bacterium]